MTLAQGSLLNGHYRIQSLLSQGETGAIYQAEDERSAQPVAIHENLFTGAAAARQFRLEAVILSSLSHPSLPRVTDHLVIAGQGQYLVMDFIAGEDLAQRLERTCPLPEAEALQIGLSICATLDYLHSRRPPVVHRNLKLDKIKITPAGAVYLLDFGFARLLQDQQDTTPAPRILKPGFAPPEQYGGGEHMDPRSDIYALGAILYTALAGLPPADSLSRAMNRQLLSPIRKHNPAVSRRLAEVIEKALEPDPAKRFQSAMEFHQKLLERALLSGHG